MAERMLGPRLAVSVLLAALALALAPAGAAAQDLRFFRIGTGTTAGTYFPIGAILANAVSGPPGAPPCELGGSCGVPGLIAVAQASSGSVENIANIRDGTIDSGFSQADIVTWAYTGTGLYAEDGPIADLRAIAHLYNELIHVVVPADSPVETVADLRGRRVALGDEGSGTLIDARLVLEAYGLSEADLDPFYLAPAPASDAMLEGTLDAFVFVGGVPLVAVEDLARRMPIRLVAFDDPVAEALVARIPFFTMATLPADGYPDVDPVPTLAVGAMWVTSANVDEETIYGLTAALWHPATQAALRNGHPRGREIGIENALRGVAIPLHPGALRYYRDVGLVSAADAEIK
jgi:TRAP transporter TAXI family solute receptor